MKLRLLITMVVTVIGIGLGEPASENRVTLVLVTGIPGTEQYEEVFAQREKFWRDTETLGDIKVITVGDGEPGEKSDRRLLQELLEREANLEEGELWLVLNGHGTFDGKKGKFNLRGRDVSSEDLADWLKPCRRPLVLVNCFSASASFIQALSGPNRVVLSATRSGYELNYSRFGTYFAKAINSPEADLDQDGQVSLLEAFLKGSRDTGGFYSLEGRIASEHALLDDTGDQQGTGPDWYRGVRVVKETAKDEEPDGRRAHQFHLVQSEFERSLSPAMREQRNQLELKLLALRDRKDTFEPAEYDDRLEEVLLELSEFYVQATEALEESE